MNNNFQFYLPARIIFGKSAVNSLPEAVYKEENCVLLVTGSKSARNTGLADKVKTILKDKKIILFDKVAPEPDTEIIDEGIKLAKQNNCKAVIGLGGGSALDVAKAVAALVHEKSFISVADFLEVDGTRKLLIPGVPFIAVPTTSGTGSEVTKNSVIINKKLANKRSLRSDLIFARCAIVDPELTLTLSAKMTAETGLDALTHTIEGYISKKSNKFTDAMAIKSIELVQESLITAVKYPDNYEAREKMSLASLYGGILIANSGVGLVHAIAPFLGSLYGTTHGLAVAVLLPYMMEYNMPSTEGKIDDELIAAVKNISEEIGIPQALKELGIPEKDIPLIAEKSMTSVSIKINPAPIDYNSMVKLLQKCWAGS
ncbi:MAG: iron-containing alcohol dehydrogenase [Elusimicrobia bacterium]|nr:iron-containing alcohol dehydrogenase [Elusimicrobiota bacterium]MBU2615377.1 iron-containing alcohol dehydrogenase [Elusimicrobiota bacterium]